ncbi:MAG: glycosyltransferase family 9 protein [Gemmatimonadota bacterium]|jgi:heptosyltransferase I
MPQRSPGLLRTHRDRDISIVLLTGIGDVVHGLPLACDLKRDDPRRRVLWVAEPAPAEVVRHHPAVDEVVVFDKSRGLHGIVELRRAFRGRRTDVTLNMQRYFKSVFPTLLSGAPVRVGLPPSKTRDGVRLFNTHHLPEQPWRHIQDLLLDYRRVLGLADDAPVEWRIAFTAGERNAQRAFFDALPDGRPVAGVVLATANPKKDWPVRRYVELVDALGDGLGYTVVLVGGPAPEEKAKALEVRRACRAEPVDALGDSVRRMMWMVDGVDVLVSPDTGPLHIAHALAVPVVGLYGHTNPWRVGPYRRYRDLVVDAYTEPGAAPDPAGYEPKQGRLERITTADVLARVERARECYGAGRRRPLRTGPEAPDTSVPAATDPIPAPAFAGRRRAP